MVSRGSPVEMSESSRMAQSIVWATLGLLQADATRCSEGRDSLGPIHPTASSDVRFGSKADIGARPSNVPLRPKADIGTQPRDVRFVPKADISRSTEPRSAHRSNSISHL